MIEGRLFSIPPPTPTAANYPRLVLPVAHRKKVINRAHKEVGHMATAKTLDRLREAYVWQGMRRDIESHIELCPVCCVHQRWPTMCQWVKCL